MLYFKLEISRGFLKKGCVDDFSARALGCDLMVHYGHSCLIPIDRTSNIKMLYVFVSISIDPIHFIESIVVNFASKGTTFNCYIFLFGWLVGWAFNIDSVPICTHGILTLKRTFHLKLLPIF